MGNIIYLACLYCFLVSNMISIVQGNEYCYNKDTSPYRYYATKTKYEDIRTHNYEQYSYETKPELLGCTPKVFYILSRHGTRYPDEETVETMNTWLPQLQQHILTRKNNTLCKNDIEAIRNWTSRMTYNDSDSLASEGWKELRNLALRYKTRYPSLLNTTYNQILVQFIHTEKEKHRTRDSAKAFAEGMFGKNEDVKLTEIPKAIDHILGFYKICDRYKKEVGDLPAVESQLFLHGIEMKKAIKNAISRLGVSLTIDKFETLYDACHYEHGLYNDSPWCATFTKEDLIIMEYRKDLKIYWKYMYGHEINYKQSCELLKDVMKYLRMTASSTENDSIYQILGRFGHSATLNIFYALLGLYKDEIPLKAENFKTNSNRKLRSSLHTSMSSNIVFVYQECSTSPLKRIEVIVNEKPLTLPLKCCHQGVCDYSELQRHWEQMMESCNIQKLCTVVANKCGKIKLGRVLWIFVLGVTITVKSSLCGYFNLLN